MIYEIFFIFFQKLKFYSKFVLNISNKLFIFIHNYTIFLMNVTFLSNPQIPKIFFYFQHAKSLIDPIDNFYFLIISKSF